MRATCRHSEFLVCEVCVDDPAELETVHAVEDARQMDWPVQPAKVGDTVLLLERHGTVTLVHYALVRRVYMQEELAGARGEMAIGAVWVSREAVHEGEMLWADKVVHMSHAEWGCGAMALAYEEMPAAVPGLCRFCRCTDARACDLNCSWMDMFHTVCSSEGCRIQAQEELLETGRLNTRACTGGAR